jgi:putative ABC transport system permease protein
LYKEEDKFNLLIGYFSIIAILIACLGLFGLVSFSTQRRKKEIGIRKINGAKISEILVILNKDFIIRISIAFIIAIPIAWYAMHKWLQSFAYKTELSWWIFILAGIIAMGIALITVSWQSWRAATRNPVDALRYE